MGRRLLVVAGVLAGAGVLAAAARATWPAPATAISETALVHVSLPDIGGTLRSVRVSTTAGRLVPVRLSGGDVWPATSLPQGERLVVEVSVRRPGWAGWLVGSTVTRTFTVTTPTVHVQATLLHVRPGDGVAVRFDAPAAVTSVDGVVHRQDRAVLPIDTTETAGAVEVAAAARTWERLSTPVHVSWFPTGISRAVVATPAPGTKLGPTQRVTLTFSSPIERTLPPIKANAAGRWQVLDDHSIAFDPSSAGFPLGGRVRIVLPRALRAVVPATGEVAGTLSWPVKTGTTLRLQQLLAQLDYLPLRWQGPLPARTTAAQVEAAVAPPAGTFAWRWARVQTSLRALWTPGTQNLLTQAALMRYEDAHGLPVAAAPTPTIWRALFADVVAGRLNTEGYTYVLVHETVPESLRLWHNGKLVLTTPGNTGIPQAPTTPGTFPVFEHIPIGTMSGTNPDGSHYNDPGVRWISYFHGGDAIHAFPRGSYGTPQSLGCVELPYTAASQVWPYTPVGTLVTIEQ
ncbi:MAG TPA: L,D-transpeptidase [Gaiellaceae bacterium]|nr:L,D-transpeptidase [Gaiellaceae bacterium]